MSLQLMSVVWGSKHIELFKETAVRSMGFKQNLKALVDHEALWNIFTDDENIKDIEEIIKWTGLKSRIKSKKQLRNYIDPVQSATIWQIEECLSTGSKLLLVPPDTIYGDGSVPNLLKKAKDKGSVLVVPHPRVLPSFVNDFRSGRELSNPELVSLAFKHLHRAWTEAEKGCPNQSSYVGGVEWERQAEDHYKVIHRLPSPYLINFEPEDLNYFKNAISFGHFDHMWPGDILVPKGRQVYIDDSDIAFICEVTDPDKNVPPIIQGQPTEGFWRNHVHNVHNAQITATFKGIGYGREA